MHNKQWRSACEKTLNINIASTKHQRDKPRPSSTSCSHVLDLLQLILKTPGCNWPWPLDRFNISSDLREENVFTFATWRLLPHEEEI